MKTLGLTVLALVAFASNSLLCRLALHDGSIDAASFSTIRLASGAAILLLVSAATRPGRPIAGSWSSAAALFAYAVPFGFAYVSLTTGTGALVLFGAVQATMQIAALVGGERPSMWHWTGLAAAFAGLVYLVLPGLSAPAPGGAALMAAGGVAWGVYSLLGRRAPDPVLETTGNFVRAVPMALIVSVGASQGTHLEIGGALLALASGALASGLGYVVWYAALRGLNATRAGLVQLPVPVLAAVGGILLLSEAITTRLVVSAALMVGGIAVALVKRRGLAD